MAAPNRKENSNKPMKNKTKIMLGLSVLTAGTLAAGATGTLAWFTTNKTASATYNNIKVQGTTGNLEVAIAGLTDTAAKSDNTDKANAVANGATSATSDVSSKDGITFYQPDWKGKQGNKNEVNSIKKVDGKSGYYTQYFVTVSNATTDEASTPIDVYLSKLTITATKANATETELASIASWTRVAITSLIDEEQSTDNFVAKEGSASYVFQNDISKDAYKQYISSGTPTGDNKISLESAWNDVSLNQTGEALKIEPEAWKNLGSTKSIKLGVSVWLEGTMADDQDLAKTATISVSMTFSSKDHVDNK